MRIAIVNGSARKGNTLAAVSAFIEGAKAHHEIDVIEPHKLKIGFCRGCGACECVNGCVDRDDTNPTVDKLVAADVIVFATPVYWWGISAQTKLIIDKCYCRAGRMRGKKIGVIVPGGSPVDAKQYTLIREQFGCIAAYLGWDILFFKPFYATEADELAADKDAMAELRALGENL